MSQLIKELVRLWQLAPNALRTCEGEKLVGQVDVGTSEGEELISLELH